MVITIDRAQIALAYIYKYSVEDMITATSSLYCTPNLAFKLAGISGGGGRGIRSDTFTAS